MPGQQAQRGSPARPSSTTTPTRRRPSDIATRSRPITVRHARRISSVWVMSSSTTTAPSARLRQHRVEVPHRRLPRNARRRGTRSRPGAIRPSSSSSRLLDQRRTPPRPARRGRASRIRARRSEPPRARPPSPACRFRSAPGPPPGRPRRGRARCRARGTTRGASSRDQAGQKAAPDRRDARPPADLPRLREPHRALGRSRRPVAVAVAAPASASASAGTIANWVSAAAISNGISARRASIRAIHSRSSAGARPRAVSRSARASAAARGPADRAARPARAPITARWATVAAADSGGMCAFELHRRVASRGHDHDPQPAQPDRAHDSLEAADRPPGSPHLVGPVDVVEDHDRAAGEIGEDRRRMPPACRARCGRRRAARSRSARLGARPRPACPRSGPAPARPCDRARGAPGRAPRARSCPRCRG